MSIVEPQYRILDIQRPFGRILLATGVALVVLSVICEVLARNQLVESVLILPSVNGNSEIGTRLVALDRMVQTSGPPDCFIIGDSTAVYGMDPDSMETAFKETAHQELSCFNFALSASNALGASKLARILVQTYHPRILIYGVGFRDLISPDSTVDIPWSRYQLEGEPFEGWLESSSYAYRYMVSYRILLREGRASRQLASIRQGKPTANGLIVEDRVKDISTIRLGNKYIKWSKHYDMDPILLTSLDEMLTLNSASSQVIIAEMPIVPGVYEQLPKGEQTHQTFIQTVAASANAHEVPFILADTVTIPDNGWFDGFHLNLTGAQVFSKWLGGRIAAILQRGEPAGSTQESP